MKDQKSGWAMEQKSSGIKSVQLGFITFISQTGVGIVMLSSRVTSVAGHDGLISIVLTCLLVILSSVIINVLLKRYSDQSIYDICRLIFGKYIGMVINILLLFYLIVTSAAGASMFNYFIRITLLQETPAWALGLFIILPSLYLVWQGLKPVARFLYISVYSYFAILVLLVLLLPQFRLSFLLPFGEAGVERILYGMKDSFLSFLGFELIGFFYPYVVDRGKALKSQILAISASLIFYLAVVGISIGVFGEHFLKELTLPFFNISRIYNAPVLERVDLYLTALWFIPMACGIRSYIFAAFDGLNKVLRLKKTKLLYVLFFAFLFVSGSLVRDINQLFVVLKGIGFACAGITALMFLCYVLSFFRKKGVYSE